VDDAVARERVARAEQLLGDLEALPDTRARETASAAVQALVELYGEALARVAGALPEDALARLAGDELVAHLLLIHDLHPVPVEERVRAALAGVDAGIELIGVDGVVARVQLPAMAFAAGGCGGGGANPREDAEAAVFAAAPDVEQVVFVGAAEPVMVLPQVQVREPRAASA